MIARRHLRLRLRLTLVAAGATAVAGAAACVDLFHDTDFETRCASDAAACQAPAQEAAVVEASVEAGPAGPLDVCSWSSSEAEAHAERACAWMGACGGGGAAPALAFGACVIRARAAYDCKMNPVLRPRGPTEELWKCVANVTSCDEVNKCLYNGFAPACGPLASGATTGCAPGPGDTLTQCGVSDAAVTPLAGIEPCVLEGRSCAVIDGTRAACAGGGQHALCVAEPRCIGQFASVCGGALDVGVDCSAFGSGACVVDSTGVACAPAEDAGACTGSSKITCDDAGVAHSCVGGREVTVDCSALAISCVDSRVDSGVDPLLACGGSVATGCFADDVCVGTLLKSCAQGKAFQIDCQTLGLGPCVIPPPPRAPIAACTPK